MMENELEKAVPAEEIVPADEVNAQETAAEEATPVGEIAPAEETAPAADAQGSGDAATIDWFSEVLDILEVMLFSIFAILLLFSYLLRPVTVDGSSMVPTLHDKDRLVMFRLFYTPHRGDVVVVNDRGGHVLDGDTVVASGYSLNECIIKRVIGVPGQEIYIDETQGALYVDGELQDEPYINELTYTNDHAFEYPITVPEGYVFVMGDNRNHSTDSRSAAVGLVDYNDVMGKAFFRYHVEKDPVTSEKLGSIGFIQ